MSTENKDVPGYGQNYNRYSYAFNNPLKYTDPDGEFAHLIIGALIGGTINWLANGADFSWQGLGYFGVGAAAGALSAGIGMGVSSALAGGSFGAGFIGSTAAKVAGTSFFTGFAIGGSAGFTNGFVSGTGNSLIAGNKLGSALGNGMKMGIIQGGTGALLGGIAGGIDALADGRRFFDGATVEKDVIVDQNIPIIGQRGNNNCLPANVEAIDKSFGGSGTQEQVRNWFGGDPNTIPLNDVDVWSKYSANTGHQLFMSSNKTASLNNLAIDMQNNIKISINLNTGNVGHSVVMNSITQKTITKLNGRVIQKYIYYIMNPANGGSYMRISGNSILNSYNIFFIYP